VARKNGRRVRKLWAYVFAYGSNLDFAQMCARCPSTRMIGAALLPGFRLAFVGFSRRWGGAVATVTPALDCFVLGMVYAITFEDLAALDGFEGTPHVYKREPALVQMLGSDEEIEADCYHLDRLYGWPSREYVAAIRRGFAKWGFDRSMLDRAVRLSMHRATRQREELARLSRAWEAEIEPIRAPRKCKTTRARKTKRAHRKENRP